MRANDGSGDNISRDVWETPGWLYGVLDGQYFFEFDCCANSTNAKERVYSSDFESVGRVNGVAWMNPPFSVAREMFEHFFKAVSRGVAIYRCDNLETRLWQDVILPSADWVFVFRGRINYEGFSGSSARFPSALIGVGVDEPKDLDGFTLLPRN